MSGWLDLSVTPASLPLHMKTRTKVRGVYGPPSKFKGVSKCTKNRWQALVMFGKHSRNLGSYRTEKEAADTYARAVWKLERMSIPEKDALAARLDKPLAVAAEKRALMKAALSGVKSSVGDSMGSGSEEALQADSPAISSKDLVCGWLDVSGVPLDVEPIPKSGGKGASVYMGVGRQPHIKDPLAKGGFMVQVKYMNKNRYLGTFDDEHVAGVLYARAKQALKGYTKEQHKRSIQLLVEAQGGDRPTLIGGVHVPSTGTAKGTRGKGKGKGKATPTPTLGSRRSGRARGKVSYVDDEHGFDDEGEWGGDSDESEQEEPRALKRQKVSCEMRTPRAAVAAAAAAAAAAEMQPQPQPPAPVTLCPQRQATQLPPPPVQSLDAMDPFGRPRKDHTYTSI